jgi:epoxyqueuosine reductase
LEDLALMSKEAFRERFRASAVKRAKYTGLLRNAAVAMGNLGGHRDALERLAQHPDETVREHAAWALTKSS